MKLRLIDGIIIVWIGLVATPLIAGVFSKSQPPKTLLSSEISYYTGTESGKIEVQKFISEFKSAGYPTVSESWEVDGGYWVYSIKKRDPVTKRAVELNLQFKGNQLDRMRIDGNEVRDPVALATIVGGLVKALPSQISGEQEKKTAQEKGDSDKFSQLMIADSTGHGDYGISISDLVESFKLLGRPVAITKSLNGNKILKTKLDGGEDFELEFNETSIVTVRNDGPPVERDAADLWRISISGKNILKDQGHEYISKLAKTIKEERSKETSGKQSH